MKDPCPSCSGHGKKSQQRSLSVNIPSGISNDTKIKLLNEGDVGERGGENGDLYVFVTVRPHDIFKINEADLHCKLPISFPIATLGGEVDVPIIEGGTVKLKIPAGTQNGEQLKIREKGMSKIRSISRGSLFVHIFVEVPKKLTPKQNELIEELAKEFLVKVDMNNPKDQESFFDKMKNLWK